MSSAPVSFRPCTQGLQLIQGHLQSAFGSLQKKRFPSLARFTENVHLKKKKKNCTFICRLKKKLAFFPLKSLQSSAHPGHFQIVTAGRGSPTRCHREGGGSRRERLQMLEHIPKVHLSFNTY